jgi:hypothetical protein
VDQAPSLRVTVLMMPVITRISPGLRSEDLDRLQCCWRVSYQFCGLAAEVAVYAKNADEARAEAIKQLRRRGLKVA